MNFLKLSLLSITLFAGSTQLQAMDEAAQNPGKQLSEATKYGWHGKISSLIENCGGEYKVKEITDPETNDNLLRVSLEGAIKHDAQFFSTILVYTSDQARQEGHEKKQRDFQKTLEKLSEVLTFSKKFDARLLELGSKNIDRTTKQTLDYACSLSAHQGMKDLGWKANKLAPGVTYFENPHFRGNK